MALPKEVDAAKVRAVNEAIAKMTPQEIGALPPLDNDDFRLFGAISQHYCFLDLNLRRAPEIMKLAKRLAGSSLRLARSRFAGPLRLFLSLLGGLLLRSGKRPAFSNLDRLVFVCRPLGNDKDTMPNLTGGALITVKAAN
jgi:hypothetical protein